MPPKDPWEKIWQRSANRDLSKLAAPYFRMHSREIEIFRKSGARTICDAGCGFGAYTLAFASNGFAVKSFDISETAVSIAKRLMREYGFASNEIKVASILETGYEDASFDGAIAYSVLDHMTVFDAKRALNELFRITRPGGLILLAVDAPDEDDLQQEHIALEDGSLLYTARAREGTILHPYGADALENLLGGKGVLHRSTGPNGERVVILKRE